VACHHRWLMWNVMSAGSYLMNVNVRKNKFIFLTSMRRRKPTSSDIFPPPSPTFGRLSSLIELSPRLVSS
jgi:hypothetical protein